MLVKVPGGWVVTTRDRKRRLGRPTSYARALAQLRAIEASKRRRKEG